MTPSQVVRRKSTIARLAYSTVALALVVSVAGCGSRASDTEIATALGAGSTAQVDGSNPAPAALDAGAGQLATTAGGVVATGSESSGTLPAQPGVKPQANATGAQSKSQGNAALPAATSTQAAAPPTVANKSLVKIGVLGSFSGVLGNVTGGSPKTMAVWAAHTNAHGGLNGHPVKVIVADDQGDPATTLTLAKRLVEAEGVIAFVGDVHVFGFAQVEKYLREKNVPLLGGDAVDPGWFTSTIAFPVSASVATQIIKGLKTGLDQGASKFALLYCLEVSSMCGYLKDQVLASPEVGKNVIQTYQVSLVAPTYTSQCLRMKEAGVEIVYVMLDTAGATRVVQNCATQGYNPKVMLLGVAAAANTPTIPALAKLEVPGASVPPAAQGVPGLVKYHEAMNKYGPSVGVSGMGALAWAAAELLLLGSKNFDDNPTSVELMQALWNVKNETLGGLTAPLTYVKGSPPQVKPCTFVWGISNGKWSAPNGAKPSC